VEKGDGNLLPTIKASMLDGCPACPYCGNPHGGKCPCGALFCSSPNHAGPVRLPIMQRRAELRRRAAKTST